MIPAYPSKTDSLVWYCARAKPKQEHIAAANVRAHLRMQVFLPRIQFERMTRRGKVRFTEPLFPGYIFVQTGLNSQFDEIRRCFGVSSLVHFGDLVPSVPDSAIEELRKYFTVDEPLTVLDQIESGAEVFIGHGAFANLNGIVLKSLPSKKRVQILLEILGRNTVVEMDHAAMVYKKNSILTLLPVLAA